MLNPEYDLRYMQAGIEELKDYLLSNDIYRPMIISASAGERPYPPLTIGNLLIARQRLSISAQSGKSATRWRSLDIALKGLCQTWRVAWEHKAGLEFGARLTLWRNYLEEYRQSPPEHSSRYSYEVERRVMLELLREEAMESLAVEQVEMLAGLDKLLRSMLVASEFIWDADLAPAFPARKYWYLYGRLPANFI